MEENKFKIGDRVRLIQKYEGNPIDLKSTAVICSDKRNDSYGLAFAPGALEERHDCDKLAPKGCGWYVPESLLRLVKKDFSDQVLDNDPVSFRYAK